MPSHGGRRLEIRLLGVVELDSWRDPIAAMALFRLGNLSRKESPMPSSDGAKNGRNVFLVVDDFEIFGIISLQGLSQRGFVCHVAETHAQAIEAIRQYPEIDIVVLDWQIHDWDPRRFVAAVRKHRPDVMVVGTGCRCRRQEFLDIGVGRCLDKPWSVDELLGALTP